MYRIIMLLTLCTTRTLTDYYSVVIFEMTAILCLHAIIQPYKERWHNILDCLIFTGLIILNALTLYNYRRSLVSDDTQKICNFQIILLYTPLVYLLVMVLVKIAHTLKEMKIQGKGKSNKSREHELSESLLFARRDTN